MPLPTIFDLYVPRRDVLSETSGDADFSADLSHVIRGGGGPKEYAEAELFVAIAYLTRGQRNPLANVFTRLSGG